MTQTELRKFISSMHLKAIQLGHRLCLTFEINGDISLDHLVDNKIQSYRHEYGSEDIKPLLEIIGLLFDLSKNNKRSNIN